MKVSKYQIEGLEHREISKTVIKQEQKSSIYKGMQIRDSNIPIKLTKFHTMLMFDKSIPHI